jgi:antitoxin (DNA-binding transcriptional repressor) of toxin-antitoxin stability system
MRVVGIKVLKNKLSEYIRAAANGETILVTDRDRVVAEIVAPSAHSPRTGRSARWEELVKQGVITPASIRGAGPPPSLPVMKFDDLMRELEADREDRV